MIAMLSGAATAAVLCSLIYWFGYSQGIQVQTAYIKELLQEVVDLKAKIDA